MNAYATGEWSDFFVAATGASAALAGLLFVAVSINVERIVAYPGLPDRAFQTLLTVLAVLVASLSGLVPGQSRVALGVELLGLGLGVGLWVIGLGTRSARHMERRSWVVSSLALSLPAALTLAVGGISLLAEAGGGLYWVLAAVVLGLTGAILNAWVLLVEILR
jgi:hypothetical protein